MSLFSRKMSSVINYLRTLNLFQPSNDHTTQEDEHNRRSNLIATRVYLSTLTLTLIILALFFWLTPEIINVIDEYPTRAQFSLLPFDARCPCSHLTISYGAFISIQASFHQVCSSDFVSDRWIEAIFFGSNSTYFSFLDFRTYGSAQFQALASFCRLAKDAVTESISLLYRTLMISPQVLSENVFQTQVQAVLNQFQLTAPDQFKTQSQIVRGMIVGNRLISQLQTNSIFLYISDNDGRYYLQLNIVYYGFDNGSTCSCLTDLGCKIGSYMANVFGEPSQIDHPDYYRILMYIPGIIVSCLPADSLLASTLECFYSQTCIDTLMSYFPTTETFTAMITSNESRFKTDSTVEMIVGDLMVETWITNISYDKYYAQCAPIACTYSISQRHNFLFVLLRLIRSFGVLTMIFGLLIPMIIRFIRRPHNVEVIPCKCQVQIRVIIFYRFGFLIIRENTCCLCFEIEARDDISFLLI